MVPWVRRWGNLVQVDIIPSDLYSCYIILSNDGGGLLRLSGAKQRQQQEKCPHRGAHPSAAQRPGSESAQDLVLLLRAVIFNGQGEEGGGGG